MSHCKIYSWTQLMSELDERLAVGANPRGATYIVANEVYCRAYEKGIGWGDDWASVIPDRDSLRKMNDEAWGELRQSCGVTP